jgi:hypothetical protein
MIADQPHDVLQPIRHIGGPMDGQLRCYQTLLEVMLFEDGPPTALLCSADESALATVQVTTHRYRLARTRAGGYVYLYDGTGDRPFGARVVRAYALTPHTADPDAPADTRSHP